ncbi:hypothetical protein DAEQUDRAFT_692317 [Daedalea quercina L-15889]|uniref:Oxidase ustYa n=1 Tax=Daedalea quercina L-15889 TaxID=1314783 RepID=A0A165PUN1_9APHY|nr:hypothetical protein DAEQUDRAFT_692317 [Daedalea quercina L-15889]
MAGAQTLLQAIMWIIVLLQVIATAQLMGITVRHANIAPATGIEHTYIGHDYPEEYPLVHDEPVSMTLHETVHYTLNLSDQTNSEEWNRLDQPKQHVDTHLGPQQRVFVLTFGHQLHCLRSLYTGLLAKYGHTTDMPNPIHWQHCLNYLRQTFLCDATDVLEEGDFTKRDYTVHRQSGDIICKDWTAVFDVLDRNEQEWLEWRAEWVGPPSEVNVL